MSRYARICAGVSLPATVNRRLGPAELKRSQPAHMPDDNHTVLVDHDRLLPPELLQGRRDLVDRSLRNLSRVLFIRRDFAQCPDLDFHAATRIDDSPAAVGTSYTSEWHLGFLGNRNFATF
jgi:hypothetical protein